MKRSPGHRARRISIALACAGSWRATTSPTYDDLLARATADPAWYWEAVAEDLDLIWSRPYEQVLDLSRGAPWAEWFTGGGFNYVTSALDRHAAGPRASAPR